MWIWRCLESSLVKQKGEMKQMQIKTQRENARNVGIILMGRDLDRVRVKSPNITGILFFEFKFASLR
jgi:hypothetical protein